MADTDDKKEDEILQSTNIPEEVQAILDHLPDNEKKNFEKFVVKESFGMMGIGHLSQENEIAKKINEEHITNYLDGAKEQMQNVYKERHEKKVFTVILVALALTFFITVIILLKENTDVLEKIIYSVAGLLAGAFGGYGIGRHQNDDND